MQRIYWPVFMRKAAGKPVQDKLSGGLLTKFPKSVQTYPGQADRPRRAFSRAARRCARFPRPPLQGPATFSALPIFPETGAPFFARLWHIRRFFAILYPYIVIAPHPGAACRERGVRRMRFGLPAKRQLRETFPVSLRDTLILAAIMAAAAAICAACRHIFDSSDSWAPMVFVLAVLFTAINTTGYLYGLLAAIIAVFGVNYVFTYPYYAFNFTMQGYAFTFAGMLAVSLATSLLTTRLKRQEYLRSEIEREKMRANLLRAVSHDLRTPLTSIAGASGVLLDESGALSEAQQTELLRGIHRDAEWLIRIVENLLSITRIGSRDPAARLHKELQPAEEIISEAVQKFRKSFAQMPVKVEVPQLLLMVPMDALLIEQVLINLMENVVYHAQNATCIHIQTLREGLNAAFYVRDNGSGIPPELLGALFSGGLPAERRATSDGRRNMGIGLSVCSTIVEAHGGEMAARNLPGGGAEFCFRLPLEEKEDTDGSER